MPELVLYGIRLLAKQFLGTVLDIDVDQSGKNTNILIYHVWMEEEEIAKILK